jgi:lipopolysaccharide transport system ATP-binding protein
MVRKFCTSAIYLKSGRLQLQGDPEFVTEAYLKDMLAEQQQSRKSEDLVSWKAVGRGKSSFGTRHAEIRDFSLLKGTEASEVFMQGDRLILRVTAWADETITNASISIQLRDFRGYSIYGLSSFAAGIRFPADERVDGLLGVEFALDITLAAGVYTVALGVTDQLGDTFVSVHEKVIGALNFTVLDDYRHTFNGVVDLRAKCERIDVRRGS